MKIRKAVASVLALLLLTSGLFAKGGVKESSVAYKTVMQRIASCDAVEHCGRIFMKLLIITDENNKTDKYPAIADALNKSPVFNTYTIVLVEPQFLVQRVSQDLVAFLSNPYKEVPFTTLKEDSVYRFYFSKQNGSQVWATVNTLERRIYIDESSIRDGRKGRVIQYIVPK